MIDEPTPTPDQPAAAPLPPAPSADQGFGSYQPAPSSLSTGPIKQSRPSESGIRRQGGILMMAGAVVVLASLPLPKITIESGGLSRSINGMNGVALWLAVICGFAFLRGFSAVKPIGFRTSLPILSGGLVLWAIYEGWQGIDAAVKSAAGNPAVHVSAGIGFWITCVGGALILIGSLILQFVKPQQR